MRAKRCEQHLHLALLVCFAVIMVGCGGGSDSSVPEINTPPISATNSVPQITSSAFVKTQENVTNVILTLTANDPDNDTLTFAIIGGADSGLFNIDEQSGEITFKVSPDFESPSDSDTDNQYELSVSVSDGINSQVIQDVVFSVTDISSISAKVTFPPLKHNFGGGIESVSLAGILEDSEDGVVLDTDVVSMTFNGVPVDLPLGGDKWAVSSTMQEGISNFELALTGLDDQTMLQDIILYNHPIFDSANYFTLNASNNSILAVDSRQKTLISMDLTSGQKSLVSGGVKGAGIAFSEPVSVALDADNGKAYVTDRATATPEGGQKRGAIIEVDINTGERTLFTNAYDFLSGGPFDPYAITFDKLNNRLIVTNDLFFIDAIISIDIETGIHSMLSDENTGSGENIVEARDLVFDEANNRLLIAEVAPNPDSIVSIDLDGGVRTVLSSGGNMERLAYDSVNNRLFSTNPFSRRVIEVDLSTGEQTTVSDDNLGEGVNFEYPLGITVNNSQQLLLMDTKLDMILSVDSTNGNRNRLHYAVTGDGPTLIDPRDLTYDAESNKLYVSDGIGAVYEIELETSNRRIISSNDIGLGVELKAIQGVSWDSINKQLLVSKSGYGAKIIAVNPSDGNRTTLSGDGVGTGPAFSPVHLISDVQNNRVITSGGSRDSDVVAVDLSTGDRTEIYSSHNRFVDFVALDSTSNTLYFSENIQGPSIRKVNLATSEEIIISDENVGEGPILGEIRDIVLDKSKNRLIFSDNYHNNIVAVDIETGNRVILSDNTQNRGIKLHNLRKILFDETENRLFAIDRDAVIQIDLNSGIRTILSR